MPGTRLRASFLFAALIATVALMPVPALGVLEQVEAGSEGFSLYGAVGWGVALLGLTVALALFARLVIEAVRRYVGSRERIAVAEALAADRRRTAAEVHDLVMQELSLALGHARMLADDPALAGTASAIVTPGERALLSARAIVVGLADRDAAPVAETLRDAVNLAARGRQVSFDANQVAGVCQMDGPTSDALVHIARESVTNAVKHSDAHAIRVVLEHDDEWHLMINDDGEGFFPGIVSGGFGLKSMREMASSLGGSLKISSSPGLGTTVEASLP
jgi:signal transduction histidine kinase